MNTMEQDRAGSGSAGAAERIHEVALVPLVDVLAVLRRRKGLVAFGVAAGLVLGCLYYFQAKRTYESAVQILVMQKNPKLATQGGQGADDVQRNTMTEDILSTHIQLFRSPRIIKEAVQKNRLDTLPTIARQLQEQQDPVEYIANQLTVLKGGEGRARDAHVLRATFRGPSAADCAAILDALVQSYQSFLGETFQGTSQEAVGLISKAKTELGEELRKQETAYREFREKAPLLWDGDKTTNLHKARLDELERSLAEVRIGRMETKARLDVIEEALRQQQAGKATDLDKLALLSEKDSQRLQWLVRMAEGDSFSEAFVSEQPLRTEAVRTEYDQLLTLLLEEKTLLRDYGSDHPRVQMVQQQIELTKKFLQEKSPAGPSAQRTRLEPGQLLALHVNLLRHDLSEMDKREGELVDRAKEEEGAAKTLVSYELQGEAMRTELDRKKILFDAVINRLREINLIKDYGGYLTEVIAPVEEAKEPVAPRKLVVLVLSLVAGLFGGGGLAYAVDMADRTFRSAEEVHHALGLPIIGQIPPLAAENGHVAPGNGDAPSQVSTTIYALHRPKSQEAEAFRGLRTALYFSTFGGSQKVIQVTSPNPGDGKSTLAANLAVSMAQSGKRVLLVDCDLRRSSVHTIFGIQSKVGLSNVIVDEVELADAVQASPVENLWILPAGPHPPNPSELLTLPRFEQFVDLVRQQYDFVLLDSPPLLAVSDPAVIAPRADGVLLAMRVTKNGRPQAIHARAVLNSLGVQVLGLALNAWHCDRYFGYSSYGRGYGQRYSYGYGYGHKYYGKDEAHEEPDDEAATPLAALLSRVRWVADRFSRRD